MLMRELCKPGSPGLWRMYRHENSLIQEDGNKSGYWWPQDVSIAIKEFDSHVNEQLKKGRKETERSLSRRTLQHTENGRTKFWIVWVEKSTVFVHYGRIGRGNYAWTTSSGQTKPKEFSSREKALEAYEKMIAEKLVEGYEEIHQRKTEYSHLGQSLAEKKRATPKPVRAVKEIPAEENLAKVLGDRPKQVVNTEVTHRIDLDPADWYWASWKPWKPLPRPEPKPFDLAACLERASKVTHTNTRNWAERLQIPQVMTRQEAHFWLWMLSSITGAISPADMTKKIGKRQFDGKIDFEQIKKLKPYLYTETVLALSNLITAKEILELAFEANETRLLPAALRQQVFVYCTNAELMSLRTEVAAKIDVDVQPVAKNWLDTYPPAIIYGAVLGCHQEMRELVQKWQPDSPFVGANFNNPPEFIFALGHPELIESEYRRLNLKWYFPEHIKAWLATTETRYLDVIRDTVLRVNSKADCEKVLEVFAKVKAPEAAPYMLELSQSAKSPKLAREWLSTEVGNAITGLIPVAAGQGKLAEAALAYLREKNREGHAGIISKALKSASAEVAAKIQSQVLDRVEKVYVDFTLKTTPAWLAKAAGLAASQKPLPGADFVQIAQLSAVIIEGKRLNPEQIASLLLALQNAQPGAASELLSGLKKNADPETLDAFAWSLFEQWLAEGGPPKQKWAMRSLGLLGSDTVALKLAPLIRAWPGESQHPRAVLGLECLRAIGTDTALMQLNGIAVKLKFKALQNKARELMEAIATEKGLTAAQLEDRIVPDCDLDERGTRVFDFGPRQFRFVLGPEMKPMLKDAEGKVKTDLPKPGAKDDTTKAEVATADWKLLKKQIKDVATVQVQRLEQAMVTGRRWPVLDFETLLVKHPLMTNLTRLVLWGGYDKKGELKTTFRVTDDRSYADAKDGPCLLKSIDTVGIAHPLHLSEDQKSAWGEIFSDYEIVPPFPQLGRQVYAFVKGELQSNTITRFGAIKIPATTLVFGLEKLGWTRGLPQDNGQLNGHSKYFPTADLSAVVIFEDGVPIGYREGWEDQTIKDIYFVPGQHRVTWGRSRFSKEKTIALREIDPVIASEILNDLSALAAKGK